jgi:hypothetical protein
MIKDSSPITCHVATQLKIRNHNHRTKSVTTATSLRDACGSTAFAMATMASAADSDPDPRDPTGWAWLAVPHGDSDGSQRQSWNKEWDFRKSMKITGNSMNINEPYTSAL